MGEGKLKSELANEFYRDNQRKIEAAVEAVRRNYEKTMEAMAIRMDADGYEAVEGDLAVLRDFKTVLDAYDQLHAHLHHFSKYHAADEDAFMGGEFYLGTECVSCEFSRSQHRAVVEYADRLEAEGQVTG